MRGSFNARKFGELAIKTVFMDGKEQGNIAFSPYAMQYVAGGGYYNCAEEFELI